MFTVTVTVTVTITTSTTTTTTTATIIIIFFFCYYLIVTITIIRLINKVSIDQKKKVRTSQNTLLIANRVRISYWTGIIYTTKQENIYFKNQACDLCFSQ